MNLRTLRYFVAIADAGSFTAAATAVAIAQPALTRQLRDLEAELGVQLLQRGPRGVRLTQAGATLYESARRMLAEDARVRQQLGGGKAARQVTNAMLGVSPTLARILLPGVFERCYHGMAGVHLGVREAFTPQLVDGLERGIVDMAVVTNPEPHRALTLEPLLVEPFALVSPPARKLPAVLDLATLSRIPLLMTRLHRGIVDRMLAPLAARIQVDAEIDSVDAICELVLRGSWCTVMPVSVFNRLRAGSVRLSEISGVQLHRMLVLATRIERAQSRAIAIVGDVVRAEAAKLVAEGVFSFAGAKSARR